MHRSLRDRADHSDEGMTIVEVVVSLVILFMALTSLLSMLMASTGMSARARAEGLAVKTANQFIETVRATKYADLTDTKLSQIASTMSGTVGGMTVSVATSMTPHFEASQGGIGTPAYQAIRAVVSVSGPGVKTFRFATGTYVRQWHWTPGGSAGRVPPTVSFDSATPPAGATIMPIWDSVHIGATSHSNMSEVVLTQIYVKWGTSYLATSTPNALDGACSSMWDTTLVPEGRHSTLFAETWDALNQTDSKSRDFIIDNIKPPAPTAVNAPTTTGNSSATWTWPVVMDGESAVPDYVVTLYTMGSGGAWTGVAQAPVTANSISAPTAAFSQYYPSVVARGPRAAAGLTANWVSPGTPGPPWITPLITRPGFTAMNVTVALQNSNKPFYFTATSLGLSGPTFPVTSPSYKWEYKVGSAGAWTSFAGAASPNTNPSSATTVSYAKVTGPNGAQDLSFRCTATVTIAGNVTVFKSPIMTKTATGAGTYTVTDFTPDWTTVW